MAKLHTKSKSSRPKPSIKEIAVRQAADKQKTATARARKTAVFAFAFSGMAALIYEVIWTRELSLIFGSTVYAVSMMLTAFMSGLSLGAFAGGRWADKSKNLFALFGKLELGIAIFGLLTIPLIQVLPTLYFFVYNTTRPGFFLFFFFQLLLSFLIMLIPTTFMGATFPVVAKINTASIEELGNDVGNVYSINTVGSIIGSLGSGFLLIPLIGIKGTTFVAAGLNLFVSLTMIIVSKSSVARRSFMAGAAILVIVGTSAAAIHQPAITHNFYRIADYQTYDEYKEYMKNINTLFFADDIHGRVSVFEVPGGERSLVNDGKIEGSNTQYDRQVTSLLALIPIMSTRGAKSVLVIGLGTGLTAHAALSEPGVRVDIVEINRSVLQASRYFVGDSVEKNRRVQLFFNDARNYLFVTDKKYDVITSEPSYPVSTHVSHLFTKEFFELAAKRLNNGGVYCQWIPRYIMKNEDMLMMFKTFSSVFPQTYVWGANYGANEAQDVMLVGVNGDRNLNVKEIERAVREASQSRLSFDQLQFSFFADPSAVRKLVCGTLPSGKPIPINTDDRPILEFVAPRNHIEFFDQGANGFF
ncbi:MAG: fused MFS/spermidine synthase [Firmicutes bacterium]|nr:fused MFS/spermidine synthase [Bacillota bacterium]